MVLVYLSTSLGDFGQGQMLGFIFQHHGAYPIGSMYAIYGDIYHQYTPNVSIFHRYFCTEFTSVTCRCLPCQNAKPWRGVPRLCRGARCRNRGGRCKSRVARGRLWGPFYLDGFTMEFVWDLVGLEWDSSWGYIYIYNYIYIIIYIYNSLLIYSNIPRKPFGFNRGFTNWGLVPSVALRDNGGHRGHR